MQYQFGKTVKDLMKTRRIEGKCVMCGVMVLANSRETKYGFICKTHHFYEKQGGQKCV